MPGVSSADYPCFKSFDVLLTQVRYREGLTYLAGACSINYHLTRLCELLEARRQIWSFAADLIRVSAMSLYDITNDHVSRRNPDSGLQSFAGVDPAGRHGLDNIQAGAHSSFNLVLISMWPTEEDQHAVAQKFRHVAAVG